MREATAVIAACACVLLLARVSAASDWVDDDKSPVPQAKAMPAYDMPPVAPDRNAGLAPEHLSRGGVLTGGASMVGSVPFTAVQPMPPRFAPVPFFPKQSASAASERVLLSAPGGETVPPESLKGWLERTHKEFNLSAQNNPDAVLEIKGPWDNSSQILKAMGIAYHEMKPKELRDYALTSNVKVVVINCDGKIPADQVEPLRQWVIRGGYLISTDWTLKNFLQRAFPGMIEWNGENARGTTVDAMVIGSDPAMLKGTQVTRASWKLDDQSEEVRVLRPDAVRVLVRSQTLARTDPNLQFTPPLDTGVLACEFSYGRGKVLHLVGHFDYNSPLGFLRYVLPDAIPGAGIGLRQAIATNFLMEGLERK